MKNIIIRTILGTSILIGGSILIPTRLHLDSYIGYLGMLVLVFIIMFLRLKNIWNNKLAILFFFIIILTGSFLPDISLHKSLTILVHIISPIFIGIGLYLMGIDEVCKRNNG